MASTPSLEAAEGPVMTVISKRLRNLRKKLNKISQMEEAAALGKKTLNAEQLEVLRSKSSVVVAVEELEKLRPMLSAAVAEEIALVSKDNHNGCKKQTVAEPEPVEDLINLIYLGATFDLTNQNDFTTMMLTRAHERQSCLSYGTIFDENNVALDNNLCENDLDLVVKLGNMISRPADSTFSHKNSLQRCIQHAKQWLAKSNLPIDSASNVTYAELRAKLNKIIASGYFTVVPEIKAPIDIAPAASAAATENYSFFQLPIGTILVPSEVNTSGVHFQQKCEEPAVYQENGTCDAQSSHVEEAPKVESQPENVTTENVAQTDADNSNEEEQNNEDSEWIESSRNASRRKNNNDFRGGRGGGGRRGFPNGRGARGISRGRGPYQCNGNNQYYENGKYQPRSYHSNKGRGGGRGGGNNFNSGQGPVAQAAYTAVQS